jgi:thymidylate kinase
VIPAGLTDHRVVILDGCDGTGKTTLAGHLSAQHGYAAVHSPATPEGTDLASRYQEIWSLPGRVVLDRCFISELVYGPLRRGRSRISAAQATRLAEDATMHGAVFVHLTGAPATLAARLMARDGIADIGDITILLAAYHRVFAIIAGHATVIPLVTGRPADAAG